MSDILSIVFPIFALIAIGYGLIVSGLISPDAGASLSKFVFTLPLPLLLFRSLATSDVAEHPPWLLWGAYFLCLFTVWILGMLAVRYLFGRRGSVLAVAGISCGFSNLVLLGLPLVAGVFGEERLFPLLMLLSVHLPVTMLVSSVLVEWYGRDGGQALNLGKALSKVGKSLVTNPLIIGIVGGFLWNLSGFAIPAMASVVIDKITPVAVPLALMAMGMGMREYGIKGDVMPALVLALFKVMVFPALFLLVSTYLIPLPVEWMVVILLGAASPTGVNAYLLANHFGVGHRLAANTITIAVLLALVTFPFWISIAQDILKAQ